MWSVYGLFIIPGIEKHPRVADNDIDHLLETKVELLLQTEDDNTCVVQIQEVASSYLKDSFSETLIFLLPQHRSSYCTGN